MSRFDQLAGGTMRLNAQVFGDRVIYEYAEGHSDSICAIHYRQHEEVSLGVGIDSHTDQFGIPLQQMNRAPIPGDKITYRGATYEVVSLVEEGMAEFRVSVHLVDARHAIPQKDYL
jgi:hypothetical protein